MKKEYLHYRIEELVDNSDFIAWTINGTNSQLWEQFIHNHPEFSPSVDEARRLIELLRDQSEQLSSDDFNAIWNRIESFDKLYRKEKKTLGWRSISRYAAILVFALLLGGAFLYLNNSDSTSDYMFSEAPNTTSDSQSKIVLADGTVVDLESQNSNIEMNVDETLVIDSAHVIDLSEIESGSQLKMNEVFIPYGRRSQLVLADGTKVWLNAGSRLAFPSQFDKKRREVFLEGEAYFEVAHNEDQPFIVNTEAVAVKVLGTKFNLSAYRGDSFAETTLLEGKVVMKDQSSNKLFSKETVLQPNQRATFNKESNKFVLKNEPDADLSIAWIEGWLEFHQKPLDLVISKLERYYNVQFKGEDNMNIGLNELGGKATKVLISGKLDLKNSLEQVLLVLSDVSGFQYQIGGNQINMQMKPN